MSPQLRTSLTRSDRRQAPPLERRIHPATEQGEHCSLGRRRTQDFQAESCGDGRNLIHVLVADVALGNHRSKAESV